MTAPVYGYTGEWWKNDLDLLHLRARWYLAETGTFLSRDPVESEPPYAYVRGNPVNLTDRSGLSPLFSDPGTACMSMPQCWNLLRQGGQAISFAAGSTVGVIVAVPISLFAINYYFCGVDGCYSQPTVPAVPAPTAPPIAPPISTPSACYWSADGCKPVSAISDPQPDPVPTPEPPLIDIFPPIPLDPNSCGGCDPEAFARWWNSLPLAGGVRSGEDWYEYEQRVARGPGTMGGVVPRRVPAGAETIDADGADPKTCRLLDAKFSRDPRATQFRPDSPPWIIDQIPNEIRRYRLAITIPQNVPGAQPSGLVIITNAAASQAFFEDQLLSQGFILNIDGFVRVIP